MRVEERALVVSDMRDDQQSHRPRTGLTLALRVKWRAVSGYEEVDEEGVGGRGLSEPPTLLSTPVSPSPALPPRTRRRKEGELPGVLRGELLAVLEAEEK